MPLSIGRELRQNVGDGLRGLRYIVRVLGSDKERTKLAPPALPQALPQIDNLMGVAFRAVDNVMSAVETIAKPLRSAPSDFSGFAPLNVYLAANGAPIFCDDLYRGLKAVGGRHNPNQLILKARLLEVHQSLRALGASTLAPEKVSACFLLSLLKFNPLVGPIGQETELLKRYLAVTLLLSISMAGRVPRQELNLIVEDAVLLASTRIDLVSETISTGSEDDLAMILAKLMNQVA